MRHDISLYLKLIHQISKNNTLEMLKSRIQRVHAIFVMIELYEK